MLEELQLRVQSKLLDMSLGNLKDAAVKLRIEDSQEGVSKMSVIRPIRTTVGRNLGQDEGANIWKRLLKCWLQTLHPWKDQIVKETLRTI